MCKARQRHPATAFVRSVSCAPEQHIYVGNDRQHNDLARFCTNAENTSIVGIDPTYNMGKFYVTVTTYHHLMLHIKGTTTHPVFLGPCLLHTGKTFGTYFRLTSHMLELKPELRRIQVYGTDGEVNVSEPWKCCIPDGYHLLCDLHVRGNVESKLAEMRVDKEIKKLYVIDIFGRDIGDKRKPGIVDSWDGDEVEVKLQSLKEIWLKRHPKGEMFYNYFNVHKKGLIKSCMTAEIRAIAGLGYPPKAYTQNANESMNNVLKAANDRKKQTLSQVVQNIHTVVRQQEQEVSLALAGKGQYEIAPEYEQFKVDERRFYLMNPAQRKKLLEKFNKAQVVAINAMAHPAAPQPSQQCTAIVADDDIESQRPSCKLSVTPAESGILYPNTAILSCMSKYAYNLLTSGNDVIQAPGSSTMDVFIVTNKENQAEPFIVKSHGNGKIECSPSCWRFKAYKICQHGIAVAEH
eukprot:gene20728-biopygen17111